LHALGGSSLHGSDLGEAELSIGHLDVGSSLEVLVFETASSDDLDSLSTGGVTSGHLEVHLGDGTAKGSVSVFLVHVDGASAGVVSEENAVVLEAGGLLLVDLGGRHDLTLDSSDLVLSLHVVPELGAGVHFGGGEDSESVEGWLRGLLGRQASTDDVELFELTSRYKQQLIAQRNLNQRESPESQGKGHAEARVDRLRGPVSAMRIQVGHLHF
jgi:hypothetical protein